MLGEERLAMERRISALEAEVKKQMNINLLIVRSFRDMSEVILKLTEMIVGAKEVRSGVERLGSKRDSN